MTSITINATINTTIIALNTYISINKCLKYFKLNTYIKYFYFYK